MSTDDERATEVLIPVEQDTIPFYGHDLVAVRLADGRIAAVMNWLCDSLQLNTNGQLERIRRKTALRAGLVPVRVQTAGGPQTMRALTLKVLPGWLFTVEEHRVKAEARDDLIHFQLECVDVLAEHFARKHQPALPMPADPQAAAMVATLAERIEAQRDVLNLMQEHLAALLSLPGQVAGISEQVGETRALLETLAERQTDTEGRLATVDARTGQLTREHAQDAQSLVDRIVRETKRLPMPLTHEMLYGRIRRHFHTNSYTRIPDSRYDELMAFLRDELARATSGQAPQQGNLF